MYRRFASLAPSRMREAFARQLAYINIEIEEKRFLGFLLAYGIALGVGVTANAYYFLRISPLIVFPAFFALFIGGTYTWLSLTAESKGKFVDRVLPDALQLIASNMRAGLSTERALLVSAREEFGPLETELKMASKKVLSGTMIDVALMDIPNRIRSKALQRTIELIARGIGSGGQIADLLTQLADDLRDQMSIDDEIKANVSVYVMLIMFSALIGAPALFGVSTFIVEVLTERMGQIPAIGVGAVNIGTVQSGAAGRLVSGFSGGGEAVSPGFVLVFAEISLFITTLFAAFTIGIINSGSEKGGVKMLPVMLIVVFAVFFAIRWFLTASFGQLL